MTQDEQVQPSVEDLAAKDFMDLQPLFMSRIEELSNAQLKRVVKALVEYPFGEEAPKFSYLQETQLFNLGTQLFDCKFVLMKAVLNMRSEQMKKLAEEQTKEETDNGEAMA